MEWKPGNYKETPEYIRNGGYFSNGKSLIAIVPEEEDLDYFIPAGAITELTLEEFIVRGITEQNKEGSVDRITNEDDDIMTDEELTTYLTDWWNENIN